MTERPQILYIAEATALGGREGHARTSDGRLDVDLDVPTALGGTGEAGTNPEQLLAAGWAACFQSAMFCSRNARNSSGEFDAGVYPPACSAVLYLESSLALDAPELSREDAFDLMERAHETCPYSRATRGNIDVTLMVGGSNIERQAA